MISDKSKKLLMMIATDSHKYVICEPLPKWLSPTGRAPTVSIVNDLIIMAREVLAQYGIHCSAGIMSAPGPHIETRMPNACNCEFCMMHK